MTAWFHRLVFDRSEAFYKKHIQDPHVALGNVTSDGTLANLTALMVAREKGVPPQGEFPGLRMAGLERALRHYGYSRAVMLVEPACPLFHQKAAGILGIGEENVIRIPVDFDNRIDVTALRRKAARLENAPDGERVKIMAIIAIAGNTETGNIDDLEAVGEVAGRVGAHFHVDACWGGAALMVDEYRHLFRGIEKADPPPWTPQTAVLPQCHGNRDLPKRGRIST